LWQLSHHECYRLSDRVAFLVARHSLFLGSLLGLTVLSGDLLGMSVDTGDRVETGGFGRLVLCRHLAQRTQVSGAEQQAKRRLKSSEDWFEARDSTSTIFGLLMPNDACKCRTGEDYFFVLCLKKSS
jgi:hypothetical protein